MTMLRCAGLPEYWLVDPDTRAIEVWISSDVTSPLMIRSGRFESRTQPGLAVDVTALFAGVE